MTKTSLFKKLDKYMAGPLTLMMPKPKITTVRDINRILVIKTVAIGDLILMLPTIKALKEVFPNAKLTLLTTPRVKEVVEGFPYIDEVIYYDILGKDFGLSGFFKIVKKIKSKNFDLSIDLEHYYNFTALITYLAGIKKMAGFNISNQPRKRLFEIKIPYLINSHEVEAFYQAAVVFGAEEKKPILEEIAVSKEDIIKVEELLTKNDIIKDDLVIGINPSTSDSAKVRRWDPERFAQIATFLIDKYNAKVIITGTGEDKEIIGQVANSPLTSHPVPTAVPAGRQGRQVLPQVTVCNDFSLKQFAHLCKRFDLFISADTGPVHVASAMGAKVIGLYGPNTPKKWGPYGEGGSAIYKKLDCSPCTKQYLGTVTKCKDGKCMKAISVEEVKEECQKRLG